MTEPNVTTAIATSTASDVFIRGKSLCDELIGKVTFTEMIFWNVLGRVPTPAETAVLDACLVTLMEHGLTPSALATRLTYSSAPESMGAAVAAGLCSVGSLFVGTMDGAGVLLRRMLESSSSVEEEALRIAEEHKRERKPIPGFGHPQHKPDDPRSPKLLDVSRAHGAAGKHVAAIEALGKAIDSVYSRHITLNATGAIAAVLADIQVPYEILRGFAVIARAAGLVAHVHEEQQRSTLRAVWHAAEAAVPYAPAAPDANDPHDSE
jgi:citrate synthase